MKKMLNFFAVIFVVLVFAVSCKSPPPPDAAPAAPPPPPNTKGPDLRVTFSPKYFSPNGDKDELAIFLFAVDESPVTKWRVEIREPEPPNQLFYDWEGNGAPPEKLNWDGKSKKGELVLSATDYPFTFSATNALGNTTTIKSLVEVDVFVIQEGQNLRIQIPSIVFSSNSGNWDNMDPQITANNQWVLQRIAQILNKFPDYQVRVEGHANPTINPKDTKGREREQTRELQPLSESRAKTIVNYLVKLGVNQSRLSSFGIGGARPVAAWDDKDNWWKNRRVEFLLVK